MFSKEKPSSPFSETRRKTLLYRSTIFIPSPLLYFFPSILHPLWIARGRYHLSPPVCCIMPEHKPYQGRQRYKEDNGSCFIGIIHVWATRGTSYYAGTAPGPIHFTGEWGIKCIFHNFSCDNATRSSMLPCYLNNPLRRKLILFPCAFISLSLLHLDALGY